MGRVSAQSERPIDMVLVAQGYLGDQEKAQSDPGEFREIQKVNYDQVVEFLLPLSAKLKEQRRGSLVVISSVAGDRGRQSNYFYGSAKAALNSYLSGLRNQLYHYGVHVLTVKPGFVDTPMTREIPKNGLFAEPDTIADGMYLAWKRRWDVVYLPYFWCVIMTIIRLIPEPVFKRLKL
jgi:short-subunit dehydrogenase